MPLLRQLARLGLALALGLNPPAPLAQSSAGAAAATATRGEINLNGTWDFTPHDGGLSPNVKTLIRVPDAWDAAPGFYDATSGTYEKTVVIPAEWSGREVWLEIYEANWHVDLTVNGAAFPRVSEGIGIPTNVDITSAVRFGQDNALKIKVTQAGLNYGKDRPSGTFRWEQNLGLTGDVFLRSYPTVRVADAFVKTSFRNGQITAVYEVANRTGAARSLTLEARVTQLDGTPALSLPAQAVPVGAGQTAAATVAQAWASPHLWSPADPHLYYLETTLKDGGAVVDVQRVRFGFREAWTQGTDLILNGVPVVLFADSHDLFQHAFMNYYYRLWYDEAATRATAAQLKQQRNAIRIHQAPAVRPHVLDVFDEVGLLVISESAVYGGSFTRGQEAAAGASQSVLPGLPGPESAQNLNTYIANALTWIPKWVRRERNHPSIIVWSAENEMGPGWLTQPEDQLRQLGDRIRQHDNTRPVIFEGDHACCGSDFNSLHYNQDGPTNDWPTDNDIYAYAQRWWDPARPNSHNEYAFIGWNGNGIFQATNGSQYTNLTSLQGTRLRGGLLTRGYRYQGWVTLAPHTYLWQWGDFFGPEGRVEDDFVARSFQPVAAFDVAYDRLGENPQPPVIPAAAASFTRQVVVYNQEYGGSDSVTLVVEARADGAADPFYVYNQAHSVPRGRKLDVNVAIQNLPAGSHWIQLEYKVVKDGVTRFAGERRDFWRDGADSQASPAPTGLRAYASGGRMGVLDRRMVYLTWDLPEPRGDLAGWVIYRGTAPGPTTQDDAIGLWAEREKFDFHNEFFDVVPAAGTYYYRIRAKDLKGNLSGYSAEVAVTVADSQSPLRDPGFEMESRLYENASNQVYSRRTWGERWTLPAIHGGGAVAPHAGRFAGLINGDGAHAQNAFVDKFYFLQQTQRLTQPFHLGAYFKIEAVWRGRDDPDAWIRPGLRLAVVGGDGTGGLHNEFRDAFVDVATLRSWEGDGQWHYVYTTVNTPPPDEDGNFEVAAGILTNNPDWREPLLDAYVDDIVIVPLNRVPPVALARRSGNGPVRAGGAVAFNAAASFAFDAGGAPLAPGTGLTYAWDLGNGQVAFGPTAPAVYPTPGEYVARVTVTDQKGLSSTAQVFVTVEAVVEGLLAAPAVARLNEAVAVTLTLTGLGQPVSAAITLPPELAYAGHSATCSPAPDYDPGLRRISYSGTLASGTSCLIAVTTTVATDQLAAATVTAGVQHQGSPARDFSAALLLNPESLYLPVVRR